MSDEPENYVMIMADGIKVKSGDIVNLFPVEQTPKQVQDDLTRFLKRLQDWMEKLKKIAEGAGLGGLS